MSIERPFEGQDFVAINGDVEFPYAPAVSLVGSWPGRKEIDALWSELAADAYGPK